MRNRLSPQGWMAILAGFVTLLVALLLMPTRAAADWRPVRDTGLAIQPGNPLDFSGLVEAGPAGKYGRIVAGADGRLAFADAPGTRRRFFCASQPYSMGGFPDHATADRYARQLRMRGYNVVRFHFVETVLMNGRDKDFDFDPEQLDRFHYYLAALKREGIYWMLDALTSWNGAYGDVGPDRWSERHDVKLGVYFTAADQEHWRTLVDTLLAAENPYTGASPLQDPALLGVVLVNEGGLNAVINQRPSAALNLQFRKWLEQKYGSLENVAKKWGERSAVGLAIRLPHREWTASPRMEDAQRFYFDTQAKTLRWMTDYLRQLGYRGLITGYDNWFTAQDNATRAKLDLIATHAYHDDPAGFVQPGSANTQASSLPQEVPYIRDLAAARYWGKPFVVTEHDQPFWNKHRFESGLAIGAYAALQDWDLICRHGSGGTVMGDNGDARREAIKPYGIGSDPIARAAETLAALLFLRRDVQPAPHRVTVRLTPDYVFSKQGGIGLLPDDVTRIGLLTGIGLIWDAPDKGKSALHTGLVIDPANQAPTRTEKLLRKFGRASRSDTDHRWENRLAQLKNAGVLPDTNISDAQSSVFQSETGQIILDAAHRVLRVATDRTEAAAFDDMLPPDLPRLGVKEASAAALVAASSVDGRPIEKSTRILLIFATDARNSGMEFSDAKEKVLRRLGQAPVLMKTARVRLTLRHQRPEKLRLHALNFSGERSTELPLERSGKGVEFILDTATLPDGPTTYFELSE